MVDYYFRPQPAVDREGSRIIQEGVGQIFAVTDTAFTTPLTVAFDGGATGNVIGVSSIGQTQAFTVADHPEVYFKSGDLVSPLVAWSSVVEDARAAREAAEDVQEAWENWSDTPGAGGVDDAGMADLIADDGSETAQALVARYGEGYLFLEPGAPVPPGTPNGTIIIRASGGGGGGIPIEAVTYAEDDFERTGSNGWGTASGGGAYTYASGQAMLSVASGAGRWTAAGAGSQASTIDHNTYSQSNVEVEIVFAQTSGAAGTRNFRVYPRYTIAGGASANYWINFSLRPPTGSRPLQLDVAASKGANIGDLVSTIPGVLTTAMGQKIRAKVRVTQVDASTSRIQARVWFDGGAEPSTWSIDTTDATAVAAQAPGYLRLAWQQSSGETVASTADVYEYTARSVV